MSAAIAARAISACPSWCEEPAGHRNADDDPFEDPSVRTHTGRIGKFDIAVTEGHSEVSAPTVDLFIEPKGPDFEGPAELRQLAADALKAAEWLESQQ
jgi:hypothetical protein